MEDGRLLLPHSPMGPYIEKQEIAKRWKLKHKKAGKMHNSFLEFVSSGL